MCNTRIVKRLIVEQNGQKFGTRGTTVHNCKVLLTPDSLNLIGLVSFGALCKISSFNIFKTLLSQFSSDFNQTPLKVCWS